MSNRKIVDITIPVPWGTIAGRTFGEERNVPVLCVHGRTDNLESFCHLMPLLPQNHYYVCIDIPGHGKSSHPHEGYLNCLIWHSFALMRVIRHFKWTKLYYIGHSFGGLMGCIISALYPELVLKLIIIDNLLYAHVPSSHTATFLRELIFDPLFNLENRLSLNQAPTYTMDEFLNKMKETRKTEVTIEQIRPMAERNLVKVSQDKYQYSNDQRIKVMLNLPIFTFDQIKNIAYEISCPTMIILGDRSQTTKPKDMVNHTPLQKNMNVSFHIIEGDHDVHLAHPQQVANLISSFLGKDTLSRL